MFYQYNHLGSPDYLKVERGLNFSFPSHLHQCFEIIVVRSGRMQVTVHNKRLTLTKNQAVLLFPNQIHSLSSSESEHVLCIFSPRLIQAYATKVHNKIPKNPIFTPDEYLIQALVNLENTASSAEKKGLLYSLCAQFDKTAEYDLLTAADENLLRKIFLFVEENFHKDCSLSDLAASTGYNYSYLSRYFRKATGLSFNFYVTHYRISHACYLMENTDAPIVDCAYNSGFSSLRSFNRSFLENLKLTPTQYRKNLRL